MNQAMPYRFDSLALAFLVLVASCNTGAQLRPEKRPGGVPLDATWVGGADGGAYVRCAFDKTNNVDKCAVWNAYTGNLIESGDYLIASQNRPATDSELKHISAPDFGGAIYLENGLVLRRQ
jgi:hypothetical protein